MFNKRKFMLTPPLNRKNQGYNGKIRSNLSSNDNSFRRKRSIQHTNLVTDNTFETDTQTQRKRTISQNKFKTKGLCSIYTKLTINEKSKENVKNNYNTVMTQNNIQADTNQFKPTVQSIKPIQFPLYQKYYHNKENIYNNKQRIKTDTINNKTISFTCQKTKYKLGLVIGRGSYAIVKLGQDHQYNEYAIKIYDKDFIKSYNNLQNEIQILKDLDHDQIVKLQDVYSTDLTINLVMNYCGKNSLYSILKQQKKLTKQIAIKVIHQLLKVLAYIHKKGICHRDIKLENVLIHHNQIRLIDFGFSSYTDHPLTNHCGTPSYMAPEIINKEKYDGKASDIWALGVLFACLVQGSFPFKGANEKELFRKIRKCDFKLDMEDLGIRRVLVSIFTLNAQNRVNAQQLLDDELFK